MTEIFLHNHLYEPEGDGILLVDPGLARRSSPRDVLHTLPLIEGEVGVQVGDGGGVLALSTRRPPPAGPTSSPALAKRTGGGRGS